MTRRRLTKRQNSKRLKLDARKLGMLAEVALDELNKLKLDEIFENLRNDTEKRTDEQIRAAASKLCILGHEHPSLCGKISSCLAILFLKHARALEQTTLVKLLTPFLQYGKCKATMEATCVIILMVPSIIPLETLKVCYAEILDKLLATSTPPESYGFLLNGLHECLKRIDAQSRERDMIPYGNARLNSFACQVFGICMSKGFDDWQPALLGIIGFMLRYGMCNTAHIRGGLLDYVLKKDSRNASYVILHMISANEDRDVEYFAGSIERFKEVAKNGRDGEARKISNRIVEILEGEESPRFDRYEF